jgi:hypothetical protein
MRMLREQSAALERRAESWLRANIAIERSLAAKATSNPDGAIAHARVSLELRTALSDRRGQADALTTLADCYVDLAQPEAAALVRRLGDVLTTLEFERASALVDWLREDYDSATRRFRLVAEEAMRVGSVNNITAAIRGLGDVAAARGNREAAIELHALVAGHPATTPFSRARSEEALRQLVPVHHRDDLDAIRERMRATSLRDHALEILAGVE